MRWIVPMLALCACTSTRTEYDSGAEPRAQLIDALRSAGGGAMLAYRDQSFLVRQDALRKERKSFLDALASAAEAQPLREPYAPEWGHEEEPKEWSSDSEEVVSLPRYTRVLTMGKLYVESTRTERGTRYVAYLEASSNLYHTLAIRGTPAIDRAWQRLASRARSKAVPGPGLALASRPGDLHVELPG